GLRVHDGGTPGLFGLIGAAFAAFNRPGRAVIVGLAIGLAESYLGEVSTQYQDTLLYAVLVAVAGAYGSPSSRPNTTTRSGWRCF
ncbi:MAG: hypothetical protein J2P58_07495, partial [Acidimicrobiaceae bacterium]|nr:hypothetical protein [Acidimicrobiaceae bacterium]